jgi:hypothetical protein
MGHFDERAIMPTVTVEAIEHTAHKSDEWVENLTRELDGADEALAWRVLRAYLQVLRDRLTIDEAAQLADKDCRENPESVQPKRGGGAQRPRVAESGRRRVPTVSAPPAQAGLPPSRRTPPVTPSHHHGTRGQLAAEWWSRAPA